MTKEEAIEMLKQFKKCLSDVVFDEKGSEAWQMAIKALSQEPCTDAVSREEEIKKLKEQPAKVYIDKTDYQQGYIDGVNQMVKELKAERQKIEPCDDAISRDFQIGDEVRIIGSDPIYDDCDVGWVIRNASEKVKTMYVMRNDGSAEEEAKAEWYKTGRHNAMLAEVIKALPSVTQKSGKWDRLYSWLNDMRLSIAPDETVTDIDERHCRESQTDILDEIMEWMIKAEVEPQESEENKC